MTTEDIQRKKERETTINRIHAKEEENRAQGLAEKHGYSYKDYRALFTQPSVLSLITEDESRSLGIAVAEKSTKALMLAVLNPIDPALASIQKKLSDEHRVTVQLIVVSQASLDHLWTGYTKAPSSTSRVGETQVREDVVESIKSQDITFDSINSYIQEKSEKSTSELFETVLGGALFFRSSDIHFEAEVESIRLRYRIDGVLHDISSIRLSTYKSILSRIKLLSDMKINIRDIPQNGRFTVLIEGREIEIRSALAPSEYGENVVLRILDPATVNLSFENLGIRPDLLQQVKSAIHQPNGLVLTTGPTGSGKTTSLYAFLIERNHPDIKIITIEDPIEYHLKGVEQTEINSEAGITFFSSLSSVLRRDPDVILVGEIRDAETANAAVQAALTGHVVFSTLHTNDAAGAIPRLINLGIDPSLIPSALKLIIAQRLVRRLCKECSKEYTPQKGLSKAIKTHLENLPDSIPIPDVSKIVLKKQQEITCASCGGLGYRGRIGVYEALVIDEKMEQLISKSPSIARVREEASQQGMVTMMQDGIIKLIEGVTSLEEVERVLGPLT